MHGERPYGNPIGIGAGASDEVTVDPGARLTLYFNGACTLQWLRVPGDQLAQTFSAPSAAGFLWPIDVPDGVKLLRVTAGGASIIFRLTYSL